MIDLDAGWKLRHWTGFIERACVYSNKCDPRVFCCEEINKVVHAGLASRS